MKLIDTRAKNFLSYGKEMFIRWGNRGLCSIEGVNKDDPSASSNGSGKTGLINTVYWCLYGLTTNGLEGDEVINRRAGKKCSVMTTMEIGGQLACVHRTRKPNGLFLKVNGKQETRGTMKETQAAIEKLLGISADTFINSIVFGASAGYRFSALTDKQQKEVFDDALGISAYTRAYEAARTRLRGLHEQQENQDRHNRQLLTAINDEQNRLRDLKEKDRNFESTRKQKLKALNRELKEEQDALWTLKSRGVKKSDVPDTSDYERKLKRMREQLSQHKQDIARALVTRDNAFALAKKMDRMPSSCPECGQDVSDKHVENKRAECAKVLKFSEKKIKAAEHEVSVLAFQIKKTERLVKEAREKNEKAAEVKRDIRNHKDAIEDVTDRIKALKKHSENPYADLIANVKTAERKLWKKVKEQDKARKKVKREIAATEFWCEAFGTKGIRSYLIDTALPLLNERVAHYASMLTDDMVTIEFRTQSTLKSGATAERFEVAVDYKDGASQYKGTSGGERAKVDLCVGLALQDLVMSRSKTRTNVAYFDEVFDKMDETGVERAINVLAEIAKQRESVFVVTHMEAFKAYFPDSITITKKNGTSRIT